MAAELSTVSMLYHTNDILHAVQHVLGDDDGRGRRVVIAAYIGRKAQSYLPYPDGLRVVCSLVPGATDARTLVQLRKHGAVIEQSPRLHMKVYWSELRGCVVCSANVSANAFGKNGLREAGVYLPPGEVDIDKLLAAAHPKSINGSDLRRLTREGNQLEAITRSLKKHSAETDSQNFAEWLENDGPAVDPWKLGWWADNGQNIDYSKNAKKAVKRFPNEQLKDFLPFANGQARKNDCFLTFDLSDVTKVDWKIRWMWCDFLVRVPPTDRRAYLRGYPIQGVQILPKRRPPFEIDRRFSSAFRAAVKEYGPDRIVDSASLVPSRRLIALIKKQF